MLRKYNDQILQTLAILSQPNPEKDKLDKLIKELALSIAEVAKELNQAKPLPAAAILLEIGCTTLYFDRNKKAENSQDGNLLLSKLNYFLGIAQRLLAKPALARSYFQQACMQLRCVDGEQDKAAEVQLQIGLTYIDENDLAQAKFCFMQALQFSDLVNDAIPVARDATYGLVMIAKSENDRETAFVLEKQYLRLKEALGDVTQNVYDCMAKLPICPDNIPVPKPEVASKWQIPIYPLAALSLMGLTVWALERKSESGPRFEFWPKLT